MPLRSWSFALFLLLPQCGGGSAAAGGGEPKSAHDSPATEDGSSDGAEASEDAVTESADSEKSSASTCDDGTCTMCGTSLCPTGWYCDEKLSACSWLPACVDKHTCACVTRVLGSSCKCREDSGGLKVACD
jgi:hypothetical protein